MKHDPRDLEQQPCISCAGHGIVPEDDEGHRYTRCGDCGGTGVLNPILHQLESA